MTASRTEALHFAQNASGDDRRHSLDGAQISGPIARCGENTAIGLTVDCLYPYNAMWQQVLADLLP